MLSPPPGLIYMGGIEAIGVRMASGGERGGIIHRGANRSRCAPGRCDKHQDGAALAEDVSRHLALASGQR